jgi:hypothetical protein
VLSCNDDDNDNDGNNGDDDNGDGDVIMMMMCSYVNLQQGSGLQNLLSICPTLKYKSSQIGITKKN